MAFLVRWIATYLSFLNISLIEEYFNILIMLKVRFQDITVLSLLSPPSLKVVEALAKHCSGTHAGGNKMWREMEPIEPSRLFSLTLLVAV